MGICVCDCDHCKYMDDHCCISVECNDPTDYSDEMTGDDEPDWDEDGDYYDDYDDFRYFQEEGDR